MEYTENRNPRFNRNFDVTLIMPDGAVVSGRASNPSAYGASVEVSSLTYELYSPDKSLWEKREVRVTTALISDVSGEINSFFEQAGNFFLSLKLLNNSTWYQNNSKIHSDHIQ